MKPELMMPRQSGWALPDDALEQLASMVRDLRPRLIVECGSGRSTVVLADTLRQIGYGQLVALEHQAEFVGDYNELLAQNGLFQGPAEVRYAPIDGGWYEQAAWGDLNDITMLLVDGPPGATGPMARAPALTQLRERLAAGALVILDDTNRPDEHRTLEEWQELGLGEPTFVPHSTGQFAYAYMP